MSRIALCFTPRLLRAGFLAALVVTLTGCASFQDSRANPFNWFGGGSGGPATVTAIDETAENPLIPARRVSIFRSNAEPVYLGTLVSEVTSVQIERLPGASVVRVTGIAGSLGAYDVRLVPVDSDEESVLRFEFRALQPANSRGMGSERSRSLTAALSLTDQALAFVRRIEVVAANNARDVRR